MKANRTTTLFHEEEEIEVELIVLGNAASLLKAKLTQHFPGLHFSVKSRWSFYHPTIDVTWADGSGPTRQEVEALVEPFIGHKDCRSILQYTEDGKPYVYQVEWIILHHDDGTTATKTFTVGLEERSE